MTFQEFVTNIRTAIKHGKIKTSTPLTDFDLAVQFAIGQIGDRRGFPCQITYGEIAHEIMSFAPELLATKEVEK